MLGHRDVYYVFPPLFANTSTRIILKKPKTDSSIRKVWLPKTLAYILLEWKKSQDELKEMLRDEYQDYDLVVALPNGRPCEDRVLLKEFEKLREKAGLPKVVFHSLRHSSTTYKLKLNHGDLKATQGDTGHAQIDMITSVYAHILDEDRKVNAQKFEDAFYASANPDLRTVRPPEPPKPKYVDYETGAYYMEKPEHMTHLRGNLLVFKDHPRIILRGKIDSLESAIILVQAKALEAGDSALSAELEEVITFIRHLLRCEVSGEPVGEFQLLGLDAPALRDQSHHPSKYFGIRHFLPGVQYGPMVAELNRLRTMTRETELAAFQAFKGQHGEMDRVDIIRAFNRLSSLFWIMMFKERQKQQI